MAIGRILLKGGGKIVDKGSGFVLATRLGEPSRVVLTANHVVRNQEATTLLFAVEDRRMVPVERVERDEDLDVAVLHLSEDVPGGLAVSRAVEEAAWQVDARPRGNDPKLTGIISAVRRPFKNAQGHETYVMQLLVEQVVAEYEGYSGSPVVLQARGEVSSDPVLPGASSVIGILVEQLRWRVPAVAGQRTPPASNVLYAIAIQDVLDRYGLTVAWAPSRSPLFDAYREIASKQKRIFISHATYGTDDEGMLDTLISELRKKGVSVLVDRQNARSNDPWHTKLFNGLGDCDGAVVLVNERALTEEGFWVQDEARILAWRNMIEPEFRLMMLCLRQECQALLAQQPWRFLALSSAYLLKHGTTDELLNQLGFLEKVRWRKWRLNVQETQVQKILGTIDSQALVQAIQDLQQNRTLQLSDNLASLLQSPDWWPRYLLSSGLPLFKLFVEKLKETGAIDQGTLIKLLPFFKSSWVDLRAAGTIPLIARHPDAPRRSFYLTVSARHLSGWVADTYLQRACGRWEDENPCLVFVNLVGKGYEKLADISDALRHELFPEADLLDDSDSISDEIIRAEIQSRDHNHQPVVLGVPGTWMKEPTLLDEIRARFGPVTLFFLALVNEAVVADNIPLLEPSLASGTDMTAYRTWSELSPRRR